jgi:hypothetical protein
LPFCSNCGFELKGNNRFCNKCGYKLDVEEFEMVKREKGGPGNADEPEPEPEMDEDELDEEPGKPNDDNKRPEPGFKKFEGRDFGRLSKKNKNRVIPGTVVKSKVPKSTTCLVCNTKTDDICFFCDFAICDQHSLNMQIFADKSAIGNVIQSCPKCAHNKEGRQPKNDEASEIGFFFKIKPYHEWKILK